MKQPSLNIEYIAISRVLPYVRNARTHSRQQISQIAKSIQAFGFINPVLIDNKCVLIAGHGRVLAAQELGLSNIPAIQVEHLSEAEKRAYILADNKIAENAAWNEDLLRVELTYLTEVEIDLDVEVTGFSISEIDILLNTDINLETENPPPPPPADPISREGDLWQLGRHRVICGDCRKPSVIDQLMANKRVRMVITDPPYNVPIDGHTGGLGKIKHNNFAMACGEMSAKEFNLFLSNSLKQLARVSLDGALHFFLWTGGILPNSLMLLSQSIRNRSTCVSGIKPMEAWGVSIDRSTNLYLFSRKVKPHILIMCNWANMAATAPISGSIPVLILSGLNVMKY